VLLGLMSQAAGPRAVESPSPGGSGDGVQSQAGDHPHADVLRAIVEQLGSADFDRRRQAADRLRSIGSEAYDALREAYQVCDDYEVQLRIQEVVKRIYFDENLLGQNGFLGVGLRDVGHHDDPRVQPGHTGMEVNQVIPGTAADRVGLRRNDLIVRLDDDPLEGILSMTEFSQTIRDAGPGAMMRLGFYRGTELLEVEVVLGRRPIQYYANQIDMDYVNMLLETEVRFAHFWQRRFAPANATQPVSPNPDSPSKPELHRHADQTDGP
ncbi:MAG: PDZ domain-containing protein, partial [Phycisphaerae bacterium]